jgi:putative ABC transport system permease protein
MNWRRFFRREEADWEQRQELESYLDIATEQNIARGMNPDAARTAALLKLGNRTHIREEVYQMNTLDVVDSVARDVRHSVRMLANNKMFSAIAVVTLALGIGANTAIFSVVNAVLIKALPYPEPDALVGVWMSGTLQGRREDINLTPPMAQVIESENRTFERFGVWNSGSASVTGHGDPELVRVIFVTQGTLQALGVSPRMGRWFSRDDDSPGTPEATIVTEGYWRRRMGADPNAVGRAIVVDGRPREVIAIMPAGFLFLDLPLDLILPLRFNPGENAQNFSYQGIARLKPGVSMARANSDLGRLIPRAFEVAGMSRAVTTLNLGPAVRPLKLDVVGDSGKVLWTLMGSIGLVLLIACANVANLMLVRAEGRRNELALRAALGAGWGRIARELLIESVTLAILGGAMSLALAFAAIRLLVALSPGNVPRLSGIALDPLVLEFTSAVSILAGLLFGLVPAFKHARSHVALASLRTIGVSRKRHRVRNVLLVSQVALAVVLLVGSGLMIRSFLALRSVNPGFTHPETIQTFRISIPGSLVPEPDAVLRMQNGIVEKLSAIPGVESVAYSSSLPMEVEPGISTNSTFTFEDRPLPSGQAGPIRRVKFISPGAFKTFGTPLLAGRDFSWPDLFDKREVAIISASIANQLWGSPGAAIGKRLRDGTGGVWYEIVGVSADVYDNGAHLPPAAIVYWPGRTKANYWVRARSVAFALRTARAGTEALMSEIRDVVRGVDPELPVARVQTLSAFYDRSMARTLFTLVMLGIAGGMALVIGVIGLYGVVAYTVAQRRREVGIRMALGAEARAIKRMFLSYGFAFASSGIVLGLAAAAALSRVLSSMLFRVTALDPITYVAVPLALLLAALAACYIPARRAATVDPAETLRSE